MIDPQTRSRPNSTSPAAAVALPYQCYHHQSRLRLGQQNSVFRRSTLFIVFSPPNCSNVTLRFWRVLSGSNPRASLYRALGCFFHRSISSEGTSRGREQ